MKTSEKELETLWKISKPLRRLERPFAQAMLRLRRYVELEKRCNEGLKVQRVVDRMCDMLQINRNLVCMVKTEEDLEKFPNVEDKEKRDRSMKVPPGLAGVVRSAVGQLFLEEKVMPTVTRIYKHLKESRGKRSSAWK